MQAKKPPTRRQVQNLAVRYGEIGISAVAAAVRYQGEGGAQPLPPSNRDALRSSNVLAAVDVDFGAVDVG